MFHILHSLLAHLQFLYLSLVFLLNTSVNSSHNFLMATCKSALSAFLIVHHCQIAKCDTLIPAPPLSESHDILLVLTPLCIIICAYDVSFIGCYCFSYHLKVGLSLDSGTNTTFYHSILQDKSLHSFDFPYQFHMFL